jgi:hypothetical protein
METNLTFVKAMVYGDFCVTVCGRIKGSNINGRRGAGEQFRPSTHAALSCGVNSIYSWVYLQSLLRVTW